MDDSKCRQPGCDRRWTIDIERHDGYSAFLCEEHAEQLLAETPEDEIKRVTGSWVELG